VISVLPFIAAFKMGLMSNEEAKRKLFTAFYKGTTKKQFDIWTSQFLNRINSFIKPKALDRIRWHKERGDRVIIVSAGFDLILSHWADQEGVELISTCVDVQEDIAMELKR
jgi:phosphoserine phosphatase